MLQGVIVRLKIPILLQVLPATVPPREEETNTLAAFKWVASIIPVQLLTAIMIIPL